MALKLTLVTAVPNPLPIGELRGTQATAAAAIHVVPDNNFYDWVVRAVIGQEFGHHPTRESVERVAQAIAQEREAEFVHLPEGNTSKTRLQKAGPPDYFVVSAMTRRNRATPLHVHAVDMLADPCQQLRQGHDTGLARNLPVVVHEH
jgi:hypothetical protein